MIKKFGDKVKSYMVLAGAAAILILVIVCSVQINKNNKDRVKELEDTIAKMEREQMSTDTIREEVKQISKYSAYEFDYTSIIYHSDKNSFMGMDIPLTGNSFIATIDGKMNIGIDAENMQISQETDEDGSVKQVTITVPHSQILDNYTMQDSLKIYDQKNNIFNPVEVADYSELLTEAEEKEEQKVLKGDLLQKSDESVKFLLTSHLQAVYGQNVEIIFEYQEPSGSSQEP